MARNQNLLITMVLAIVIIIAIGAYTYTTFNPNETSDDETDDTEHDDTNTTDNKILLTIHHQGTNYTYNLSELEGMETMTSSGRYIKTKLLPDTIVLGDVHNYTGVTIETLLDDINLTSEAYELEIISSDNWTTTYTFNETHGNVDVYNEQGNITDNATATMILAYKEEGQYYSQIDPENEIGPLRVAFIGENTPITSSSLWAKMVTTINIVYLS